MYAICNSFKWRRQGEREGGFEREIEQVGEKSEYGAALQKRFVLIFYKIFVFNTFNCSFQWHFGVSSFVWGAVYSLFCGVAVDFVNGFAVVFLSVVLNGNQTAISHI